MSVEARDTERVSAREAEQRPVSIARVVPVAPLPVGRLAELFDAGTPLDQIPFAEAILLQKSSSSQVSAGLVMPIGGEVSRNEDVVPGGLRELAEETTLVSLSAKIPEGKDTLAFTYRVDGYTTPRKLHLFTYPVRSRSFSVHQPREGVDGPKDKISRLVSFTPQELHTLVGQGQVERQGELFQAAGHFTTVESEIRIEQAEKEIRQLVLQEVLADVDAFDAVLRQATLHEVNRVRRTKHQAPALDLSDCTKPEILRSFVAAQMRMIMEEERTRERKQRLHPAPKEDLLKVLPFLVAEAGSLAEIAELCLALPTHEVVHGVNVIKRGVRSALAVMRSEIRGSSDTAQSREEEVFVANIYDSLQQFWPDVLALPPTQRVKLMKQGAEAMLSDIARQMGTSVEETRQAVAQATEQFHGFITQSLQRSEAFARGVFQEYRPMNEVSNATLLTRAVMALGFHPNVAVNGDYNQAELRILRFEAMRDFAVFLTAIDRMKALKAAENSIFQACIDSMFAFPPEKTYMALGTDGTHPVYHRRTAPEVTGQSLHIITDERQKKGWLSATRKAFQDPEMNDMYSVNFAIADDNFPQTAGIAERLAVAEQFPQQLLAHIQSELAKDQSVRWKVSVLPGTQKRESLHRVRKALTLPKDEVPAYMETLHNGKRAGSHGDLIVRNKFILAIESENGKREVVEVCVYPFESTNNPSVAELGRMGFWGFAEKIQDDASGSYEATRLIARSAKDSMKESLYERLYPGQLYHELSERMRNHHVPARKGNGQSSEPGALR